VIAITVTMASAAAPFVTTRRWHSLPVSPEEDILDALSQLLESAKAIQRTLDPFVNEELLFTPARSDNVAVMFNNFDRARVAYHDALRAADRFSPHWLDG
jgi:hypothetical protein